MVDEAQTAEVAEPVMYGTENTNLFEERAATKARVEVLEGKKRPTPNQIRTLRRERRALDDITRQIVEFNYGLVRSYVRRFTSTTSFADSADFEAAAVVGLMRAIDSFDPDRGRFGSWAYKPIQREVLRAVRDAEYANMNPGDFERRPEILAASRRLVVSDPDHIPTTAEVASEAGVTFQAAARVLEAPRLDSLSTPVGDESGSATLGELIEDSTPGVEDLVADQMNLDALERHAFPALEGRELFVIVRRYGLDSEPEQRLSSIGDMLGLSREAIRQIEAKAIAKISHPVILRRIVQNNA